ncbi:MAG: hypothetical protein QOG94_1498 [Solirubrobacteraceae bacterium]|nr:hypothetical protein [Solirubrobacteraceae bacterium]
MSASARGTASDYSKGPAIHPAHLPLLHRLLAATALAGALLLLAAEASPLYTVVVGALETPRRSVTAGAHHDYALALVALAALAMALGALRGARAAAAALAVLGAVALLVALAIDLPDTRGSGTLPEAVAFADARAQAGRGLALEIAGGVALLVAGIGLLSIPRARER